jgi:hypothetical protein
MEGKDIESSRLPPTLSIRASTSPDAEKRVGIVAEGERV